MTMNILRKKRANPQINAIYDRQKFMQKVTETIQQFLGCTLFNLDMLELQPEIH